MTRGVFVTGLAVALVAAMTVRDAAPARAQSPPRTDGATLRSDLDALRREVEALRGELRQLRDVLQRAPQAAAPAGPVKVGVGGTLTMGKRDAPVTMVEFSDYQCPFCRRFSETTLPAIKTEFIDTGKVRYVFRDFPIDQIHPLARKAAEVARCAGDQGRYWEMHDLIFQSQQGLKLDVLTSLGRRMALDASRFDSCVETGKHRTEVEKDYRDGVAAGVRGTPAFFIGKTRADDTIEGVMVSGARPLAQFKQEIERLLADK